MPWRKFCLLVCPLLRKKNSYTFIHRKKLIFCEDKTLEGRIKREEKQQPRLNRAAATAVLRGERVLSFSCLLVQGFPTTSWSNEHSYDY